MIARLDHCGAKARMRPDIDHDIGIGDSTDQLRLTVRAALGVHRHVAERAKLPLGDRTGEGRGEVVRYDDAALAQG